MVRIGRFVQNILRYDKRKTFYIFLIIVCALSFVLFLYKTIIFFIGLLQWMSWQLKVIKNNLKTLKLEKPFQHDFVDPIDTWQFIGEPSRRQQIFSAYFDPRPEPLVQIKSNNVPFGSIRIFAVLTRIKKDQIYCIFKNENRSLHQIEAFESLPVHEHFNMEFSAYIIACPLFTPENRKNVVLPVSIAIAYKDDERTFSHPTFVTINYSKNDQIISGPNKKIAACVGPVQQNYNESLRIVEFIEINQLLGIEKFYLYNLNASENIEKVFNYYKNTNITEIIDWNFYGYNFETEVRYGGILVAINECIYRATFVDNYEYVAIIDFNEIIIPFKHINLLEYIEDKTNEDAKRKFPYSGSMHNSKNFNNVNAFMFRNTFFHKKYKSDYSIMPSDTLIKFLYTQIKIERTKEIYISHIHSKYIANARSIIEVGSHQIWRSIASRYSEYTVPVDEGLLFHYRTDCVDDDIEDDCKGPKVIDFSARRFGSLLWKNVDNACSNIFTNDTCPESDWANYGYV